MRKRPIFGVIFLLDRPRVFGFFLAPQHADRGGPAARGARSPPELRMETTNQEPFHQFDVVKWLGWAFVVAALAEWAPPTCASTRTTLDQ